MLNMLDLAGVPLHASERTELTPLVIAGGTAMFNCEPIADFIDIAEIGEGEEMNAELIELHRRARREGWTKQQFLRAAAQLDGIYVPGLYEVDYNADGTVKSITPKDGAPKVVTKRIMRDMDKAWYPAKTIVPSTEIVQDRTTLELFRGRIFYAPCSARRAMSTAPCATARKSCWSNTPRRPSRIPATRR